MKRELNRVKPVSALILCKHLEITEQRSGRWCGEVSPSFLTLQSQFPSRLPAPIPFPLSSPPHSSKGTKVLQAASVPRLLIVILPVSPVPSALQRSARGLLWSANGRAVLGSHCCHCIGTCPRTSRHTRAPCSLTCPPSLSALQMTLRSRIWWMV